MNGREVRVGVSLLVGNMDNMVRFYRDILGFQTQWNGGPFADFETASGELSLFMYSREEFVKAIGKDYIPPNGINQTFEIALWLPSFADVDSEYERLSKFGVQFPTGEPVTYPFGIRNFYVADPEGNLLEIGSRKCIFLKQELTSMMNIGKEMAKKLDSVGIGSAEELVRLGAEQAFLKVKEKYPNVCLVHLYALEGAVCNVEFNSLPEGRKRELKEFNDFLKS